MYRRLFSILFVALVVFTASAQVKLGFKGETSASVGIYVKNIDTGAIILTNEPQRALLPASILKSVTAATVFSTIDSLTTFDTQVFLTGTVSDGVCDGNLIVVSCGDPSVDSECFEGRPTLCSEIVDALVLSGIKEIKGCVIMEESLSDAGCIPEWEIDDVPWSYGAGLFGFNYRDNYYSLWPATKKSVPHVPNLNVTVKQSKRFDMSRGANSNNLTVYGPRPNDPSWRVNTTMFNPAEVFAYELTKAISDGGIKVGSSASDATQRTLLTVHQSPTYSEILRQTLVHSHNMFAEGMLRSLCPDDSRQAAIDRELSIWDARGIDIENANIIDGSGLARANRVQPVFVGDVLEWMAHSPYADGYVALFPKAGVEGTVKSLLKDTPLAGQLALKSGSMNGVQCFAGYRLDSTGRPTHVVVIMVNGFRCERAALRKSIENFLLNTFTDSPKQ